MAVFCSGSALLSGIVFSLVIVRHVSAEQFRRTCPNGWKLVRKETCIKFTAPLNWYEATQKCKVEGGSLFDGGGIDYQSIAAQAITTQGRLGGGWFWVNAAFLQLEGGKVWTFNDGIPMTHFSWRSGEPSFDKSKENYIVMRKSDSGLWNDEEDTTGYAFWKKEHGVVCQDVTIKTVPIFKVGTRNYTIISNNVHARSAETLCKMVSGGTLARITDRDIQTEIWRQATDKGIREDYWIAGQRRVVSGESQTGIYWLDSKKFINPTGMSGFGAGLSVAASVGSAEAINLGIFDSSQPRSAICTTKPDMILVTTTSTTSTTATTVPTSTSTTAPATTTTTAPTTTSTTTSTTVSTAATTTSKTTSKTVTTLSSNTTSSVRSTTSLLPEEPSTTVEIAGVSTKIFDSTTGIAVSTTATSDTTASSSRTQFSSSPTTPPDATTMIAIQQSTAEQTSSTYSLLDTIGTGTTPTDLSVTSPAMTYPSEMSLSTQEPTASMLETTKALATAETLETQTVTVASTDFTTPSADIENGTTTNVLIQDNTSSIDINNTSTDVHKNTEDKNHTETNNNVTSGTTITSLLTSTHTLNWPTFHDNKTQNTFNESSNTLVPLHNATTRTATSGQTKTLTTKKPQSTSIAVLRTLAEAFNQTDRPADNTTTAVVTTTAVLTTDINGPNQTDGANTTETFLTKHSEVTDGVITTTATFSNTTEKYTTNLPHPKDTTDMSYTVTQTSSKSADSNTTVITTVSVSGTLNSATTDSSQSTASNKISSPDGRTSRQTAVTESIEPLLMSKTPTSAGNNIMSVPHGDSTVSINPQTRIQTIKNEITSSSSKTVGTTNEPAQTGLTSDPSLSSKAKSSIASSTTTGTHHKSTGLPTTIRAGTKSATPTSSTVSVTFTHKISTTQNITNVKDDSGLNIGIDANDNASGNNRVFVKTSTPDEGNSNFLSRMFSAEIREEFSKPGAIAGLVVGGVALILIIIGMILAVVHRKKHISYRSKEPSIVQSDLEMTDYDNEDTNPLRTDNIIDKLASYERSLPRVNANSVSTNNNRGYEF